MYKKRKSYRKKRSYTKRNTNNSIIDLVTWLIIWIPLFLFLIYKVFIEPNLENIILILKIFIPLLLISWLIVFYYFHKKNKKNVLERIEKTPEFLLKLENNLKSFKAIRKYSKEELYQAELTGYLKNHYLNLDIEETRDFSRPDIVINKTLIWDIAIEIKWPTDMQWLKTIPDKINKYLPRWDFLYIVLFDINIVKWDFYKNMKVYNEKKKEILDNIIDSKKDKVFFIEI